MTPNHKTLSGDLHCNERTKHAKKFLGVIWPLSKTSIGNLDFEKCQEIGSAGFVIQVKLFT